MIYLSCFELSDIGPISVSVQENPILTESEIEHICSLYCFIFQAAYPREGKLFGPLPVPNQQDYSLLIYGNLVKDPKLKDPRLVKNGYYTPCFTYIFFPVEYETYFSNRTEVLNIINHWFSKNNEIELLTIKDSLNELSTQLTHWLFQEVKHHSGGLNSAQKALEKNWELLNTLGEVQNKNIRLGVYGFTQDTNNILQTSLTPKLRHSLLAASTSTDRRLLSYQFTNLLIEGGEIGSNEAFDHVIAKTTKLHRVKPPPEFDMVLFIVKVPQDLDKIKKTLETMSTHQSRIISFLVRYEEDPDSLKKMQEPIRAIIRDLAEKPFQSIFFVENWSGEIRSDLANLLMSLTKTSREKIGWKPFV